MFRFDKGVRLVVTIINPCTDMKLEADQKLGLVNQRIDVKKETAEGRTAVKSASSQTSSTVALIF